MILYQHSSIFKVMIPCGRLLLVSLFAVSVAMDAIFMTATKSHDSK